jgi:HD-like signal output (HDOD) protein
MTAAAKSAASPNAANLTSAVQEALASPTYRPPVLPSVALEVMSLSRQSEVDLGDVVKLLERDPVLAARLLALAQSARYTRRSPVLSLRQAAVRLGLETLTHLVLQAALALRIFRAPGFEWFALRVNRHATAVAHLTRDLCQRAGLPTDHAFTVGLLHDIGLLSCLQMLSERPAWRKLPFETLAPVLDAVHAEASGLLARRWNLPEPLPTLLTWHHHSRVNGRAQPTNAALIVAEQLCWEAGAGVLKPPREASPVAKGMPEQPLDGLDASWPSAVAEALEILRLGEEPVAAARLHAFDVANSIGTGTAGQGKPARKC